MPATFMRESLPILREDPSGPSTRGPHRLQAIDTCEENWFLRYRLGYIPNFTESFKTIGTLFHLILAYYYGGKITPKPKWLDVSLEERAREIYLTPYQDCTKDWDAARASADAYMRFYDVEDWRPIAVETERWATLGEIDPGGPHPEFDSEIVTCRNDLEVHVRTTGQQGVNDFKTQAMHGENLPTWNADTTPFRIDWQASVNLQITRAHYRREGLGAISFFTIQRASRKPDKKGRFKFDRHPVRPPPAVYDETPRELRLAVLHEMELIDRVKAGGRVLRDGVKRGACYHRFGMCEFADFCAGMSKEEREQVLASNYHRRKVPGGFI